MPDSPEDTGFQIVGLPEIVDTAGLRSRAPFEVLASQFVEELRKGLRPSVEIYARRYPPHAHRIRECFPVLSLLEQTRIDKEATSLRQNMPERFPFQRLGCYELRCEIARGGMGVVFQACHAESGEVVAVKLLPWRTSIVPEWQRRFEHESATASRLTHRNIVPVLSSGQEHGYCYYVMQFVNGIGLDRMIDRLRHADGVVYQDEIQRLNSNRPDGFQLTAGRQSSEVMVSAADQKESPRRRRLTRTSWQAFARIGIQAAQALEYAHRAGVLHNDIKPGNLLLDHSGTVWITDFGLSQPLVLAAAASGGIHPDSSHAMISHLSGTLRYMAPERFTGESDSRSDIYSLGITLYELAVLQPPFFGETRDQLIEAILDRPPLAPQSVNSRIPEDLANIILNCIARQPGNRYPTAEAVVADLLRFCTGERVFRRQSGRLMKMIQSVRKRLGGTDVPAL